MISAPHALAAAAAILACAPASTADASIIPVSQERYIFRSVGEQFEIDNAEDFGHFMANFDAHVSQDSIITPLSLSGAGHVGPDSDFTLNSATSYFELVFDIDQATPFTFTGNLDTGFFGSGAAHLSGPDGDLLNYKSSGEESYDWNLQGVLRPGEYTVRVYASVTISGGLSDWDFSLTIPGAGSLATCLAGLWITRGRRRQE